MKSIKIKKEYMDLLEDMDNSPNESILEMIDECGDNCYKSNFPHLLKKHEYVDLELSDEVYDKLTEYSLANNESYDILINRLLIYSRRKEYDGSMIVKIGFE